MDYWPDTDFNFSYSNLDNLRKFATKSMLLRHTYLVNSVFITLCIFHEGKVCIRA